MTTTNHRTILESLDRHRSPSATEIYSTARTYLKNTNEITPLNSEINLEAAELEKNAMADYAVQRTQNEIIDSHRVEKRKKQKQRLNGHRQRTASSEAPVAEVIPPTPLTAERSRSVEIARAVDRVGFERSKTENMLASSSSSSSDTSVIETTIPPNETFGQIQSTKLMSLSLGRGQSLLSGARYADSEHSSSMHDLQDVFADDRMTEKKIADPIISITSDEASIQQYIGQTFPLVKNIDKDVVAASSVVPTNPMERKHPPSQPLPSQVASITRSNFHSYLQPPLSNNSGINSDDSGTEKSITYTPSSGKKSRSSTSTQKRPPSNLNGVSLASLDSIPLSAHKVKDTEVVSQQKLQQNVTMITPRKSGDISSQPLLTTPPQPNSIAAMLPTKERSTHNRIIDKISLSGSNHPSRSNSPLTKNGINSSHDETENKNTGYTLQFVADELQNEIKNRSSSDEKITEPLKDENRLQGNDQLVREKLQEAKAMNRQDSTNGAVMFQFSLWKGVQKRDPIPDISLPKRISEEVTKSNETPTRPPKNDKTETSSQKKLNRLRGPRAVIEAHEDPQPPPIKPTNSNFLTPQRNSSLSNTKIEPSVEMKESSKALPIYPEISRQSPFTLRKGSFHHSKEYSEDEKYSDNDHNNDTDDNGDNDGNDDDYEDEDDNDDDNNLDNQSSGRAYAFRNMVGSCKASNMSCGSIAESVQTEMGIRHLYSNARVDTTLSVGSLSSDSEDLDEEISVDPAILAVALENDESFISNDHENSLLDESDVDQSSQSNISHKINLLQPKFSLELSLEAISQPVDKSLGPPLIKKKDKSNQVIFDGEHGMIGTSGNILVSSSLPKLPTQSESNSQVPLVRRKSASSGHTKKIREMTSAAKLESTVDDLGDLFQDTRKTDGSSPSLLSEASEDDNINEFFMDEKNFHITNNTNNTNTNNTTTTSTTAANNDQIIAQQYMASNRGQNSNGNMNVMYNNKKPSSQLHNDEVYSIHDFEWKKGNEILGEGSFGQVFKGMNCSTGELLAIKQICLTDGTEEEVATLRREIDLMDSLKHPNIVRYVGTSISSRYLYIVLEYVPGGSVAGMLSQFGAFSEVLIRRLVNQIMQGVDYLHQKGIIHRDIKGANVLVTDIGVAKLADFGCSKQLAGLCTTSLEESMRTIRGSVPWMAPEVIKQTGHGRSADIWSVGATIIEMATAKPPWQEFSNNLAALFHVATSKHPPPIPSQVSQECAEFIGRCMKIDPKERATAKELLMDPFLLALIVTSKTEI